VLAPGSPAENDWAPATVLVPVNMKYHTAPVPPFWVPVAVARQYCPDEPVTVGDPATVMEPPEPLAVHLMRGVYVIIPVVFLVSGEIVLYRPADANPGIENPIPPAISLTVDPGTSVAVTSRDAGKFRENAFVKPPVAVDPLFVQIAPVPSDQYI
jgi:hypothetical protein